MNDENNDDDGRGGMAVVVWLLAFALLGVLLMAGGMATVLGGGL